MSHKQRSDFTHHYGGAPEGRRARPPALWNAREARDFLPSIWGQYPKGFVGWALPGLRAKREEILHVCSGDLAEGWTVDRRREMAPMVVADGQALPFRDGSFEAAMIDPPYCEEYATTLYGVEYPRPIALLREACRVVKPGGRFGLLHWVVPQTPPGATVVGVWGVTTGPNYKIRAWTVFEKDQPTLWDRLGEGD